jgi:hypothetical protein
MTPEVPQSVVRLVAAGACPDSLMDRHAYFALEAAVRSEVFLGRPPLAEAPATAEEARRLAEFVEGDAPARGRLTAAAPDFFAGPAAAGLAFFLRTSGGFRVDVPEVPAVPPSSRN